MLSSVDFDFPFIRKNTAPFMTWVQVPSACAAEDLFKGKTPDLRPAFSLWRYL